jgi:hypothetical protein
LYYADIRQTPTSTEDKLGDHVQYASLEIGDPNSVELGCLTETLAGRSSHRTSTFCVVLRTSKASEDTPEFPAGAILSPNTLVNGNATVSKHTFSLSALPQTADAPGTRRDHCEYTIATVRVRSADSGILTTTLRPSRVLNWVREEVLGFYSSHAKDYVIHTAAVIMSPCLGCLISMTRDWAAEAGLDVNSINAKVFLDGATSQWHSGDIAISKALKTATELSKQPHDYVLAATSVLETTKNAHSESSQVMQRIQVCDVRVCLRMFGNGVHFFFLHTALSVSMYLSLAYTHI